MTEKCFKSCKRRVKFKINEEKEMFEHFENQLREISEKFKVQKISILQAFSDIKVEELELPRLLERMNELSKQIYIIKQNK